MATVTRLSLAYPAVFVEEEGGYSVSFPDLDGCLTEGDTLNEARKNAQEALTAYLESIFGRGFTLPPPSEAGAIKGRVFLIRPMPHVSIPLLVHQARKNAGLTQEQLAARIGVSYQNYQRWESPRMCNISLRNLEKVCGALDCELDVSLTGH